MLLLILFALTCCLIIPWLWIQRLKSANEPPSLPGRLPVIGHGHLLIGNISNLWRVIKQCSEESFKIDNPISLSIGPWKKVYVLTDPDDCWNIANSVLEKSDYYHILKPWFGEGLVTSKPLTWKRHRKMLNPAFNQAALDKFFCEFNKQTRKLVKVLETEAGRGPVDLTLYLERCSLETLCLTVLGVDFNATIVQNNQYLEAAEQMLDIVIKRILNLLIHNDWCYSFTSLKREQDECLKILRKMTNTVIQCKQEQLNKIRTSETFNDEKQDNTSKSLLDILLEQDPVQGGFTDQEVREEIDTFVAAGYDTTASTLLYILIMLGSHPDVQQKLYEELEEVFGNSCRDVEKTDMKKLVYTEAVIKETLRLVPLTPIVIRHLDRDMKLKNCTLRVGNECMLSLYAVSRHAMWGADAQEFRPERFLDIATVPDHPAALAGFSLGKRNCIGRPYAMNFMKTTLVHVLRHYTLAADYTKMEQKLGILLKPISGHYISIEKRF